MRKIGSALVLSSVACLIAACGGNSAPPPIPTASITANPTTFTLGASTVLTIVSANATSCVGTGGLSGAVTLNGTLTEKPTATGSPDYGVTCTGPGGSASASVTVTVAAPISITSVTVAAAPSTITTAQTSLCTVAVQGTGAFSTAVNWTATGGTITSGGVFTPAGVGSGSCIATSTQDSTKSGSATITVTAVPLPNVTSTTPSSIYCDELCLFVPITVNGNGFAGGQTLSNDGFYPDSTLLAGTNPNEIFTTVQFDTPHYSPGWIINKVCENSNDTKCGTSASTAFLGSHNVCATYPKTGEIFCLDQAQGAAAGKNGYVRKFKADGTADGSFFVGSLANSIALDDVTGLVLVDSYIYYQNGIEDAALNPQYANTDHFDSIFARNGWGCFLDSTAGKAGCFDLTGGHGPTPRVNYVDVGKQPFAGAMGVIGTETHLVVLSREGTPTLWNVNVSGGTTLVGSEPIPGITPASKLPQYTGGWQVVFFDSGPLAGTVATLAAADKQLDFVSVTATTMKDVRTVALSGNPFRIAADITHGRVIVGYFDTGRTLSTFTAEDPTGSSTPLASTTNLLAVGLVTDGTQMYGFSRGMMEIKPLK